MGFDRMYFDRMAVYEDGFNDGVAVALHVVEDFLESMSDEEAERIAQRIMMLKLETKAAYGQNNME